MTNIYCFTGSGHSLAIASALSEMLACHITEIGLGYEAASENETAVVVFPVYCQNIPSPVKTFLKQLRAKYIVLIATYGRISYGNVLHEAQTLVQGEVIAGAYFPIGHTFLNGERTFDKKHLLPIAERICTPQKIHIPKTRKNPLASVFPALRSRMGVKLCKTERCNDCGLCEKACPMGAIQSGRVRSECIRCLRCVTVCPQKAIEYKNRWFLKAYLNRYYKNEFVLYL